MLQVAWYWLLGSSGGTSVPSVAVSYDSRVQWGSFEVSQSFISRRTVAKGAAWGVPVVAFASAAPAFAASNTVPCPTVKGPDASGTGCDWNQQYNKIGGGTAQQFYNIGLATVSGTPEFRYNVGWVAPDSTNVPKDYVVTYKFTFIYPTGTTIGDPTFGGAMSCWDRLDASTTSTPLRGWSAVTSNVGTPTGYTNTVTYDSKTYTLQYKNISEFSPPGCSICDGVHFPVTAPSGATQSTSQIVVTVGVTQGPSASNQSQPCTPPGTPTAVANNGFKYAMKVTSPTTATQTVSPYNANAQSNEGWGLWGST